jgi:hypothetical protein
MLTLNNRFDISSLLFSTRITKGGLRTKKEAALFAYKQILWTLLILQYPKQSIFKKVNRTLLNVVCTEST